MMLSTHDKFSFVKSFLRIVGYVCLFWSTGAAVAFLIVAEVLGVAEEL